MQVNELDLNTAALDPDVRFIKKFGVNISLRKKKLTNYNSLF